MVALKRGFIILFAFSCAQSMISASNENLTNLAVTRVISFVGELVKITSKVVVQNLDNTSAKTYEFFVDPDVENYHIEFLNTKEESLPFTKHPEINIYYVQLPKALISHGKSTIIVREIHLGRTRPWFTKRRMFERNVVQYNGNVYYYSKYKTVVMSTTYAMVDITLESSSVSATKTTNNTLSYMRTQVEPFFMKNVMINYVYDFNYYRVSNVERIIDISLYGMIKITDNIVLKNAAPTLVGPYEPLFFVQFPTFSTRLPYAAQHIQYYDNIGLISTYQLRPKNGYIAFEFRPRFALMGGWKTTYSLQYLVPTYYNLRTSMTSDTLELDMPAIDHVLNDVVIAQLSVKIVLPEGAEPISVELASSLTRSEDRRVFGSLALTDRLQIELEGRNVLEPTDTSVKITFTRPVLHFLRAPLAISCNLMGVFMIVIVINRFKSGSY